MNEEFKKYLLENLIIDLEIEDGYSNGFGLTIKLKLDDELISKCDKWVNIGQ